MDLDRDYIQDLPTELGLPNQISVAGLTQRDTIAAKHSWGWQTYDIGAPGAHMAVLSSQRVILLSDPNGPLFQCDGISHHEERPAELRYIGGSSLAAPQVSGVAALVHAPHGDPDRPG